MYDRQSNRSGARGGQKLWFPDSPLISFRMRGGECCFFVQIEDRLFFEPDLW